MSIKYAETIKGIDTDRLFFIDEMGANLNHSLIVLVGRSPSHERVYDERPAAKGKRINMVSALTTTES